MSVRVEVDSNEVRILRSNGEAAGVGCSPRVVVPISDVVRATAVPGHNGARYLRLEATRSAPTPDPERDALSARFDGRQASEADRLAAMIQNNVARHRQPPEVAAASEQRRAALHQSATLGMWSAGISAAVLIVPLLAVIVVVLLFLLF